MSRTPTSLNALLAAMFLVSLLAPTANAATDPATDAQEAAIAGQATVPSNLPWTVKNELHTLHLATGNRLSYPAPPSTASSSAAVIGGGLGATLPGAGDVPPTTVGTPGAPISFTLGQTVAQSEITSLAATLYITTTTSATVTVELQANGTTIETLPPITISGVLVNLPSPLPQSAPTAFTTSRGGLSEILPPLTTLSVRISATTTSPGSTTLHYGATTTDSIVSLTADTSRVKAWTEKDGVPGVVQSSFAAPANAPSEDRTLKFILAHVHAFNETGQAAFPVLFQILAPNGKVVFDSSGSPVGVNADTNQRWGASSTLPAPDLLPTVNGATLRSYRLTFPNTLSTGAYQVRMCAQACGPAAAWTQDVVVNIGSSGSTFTLAAQEVAEKTILVGQRTTFRLVLTNTGAVEDTFALQPTIGNLQPGWTATVAPAQAKLAPGASTAVELTVVPAANGAAGQSNTVSATATSLLSGQGFTLPTSLRVLLTGTRTSGVEIVNATNATSTNLEPILRATVAPAGTVSIPLVVQNLGNGFDRAVISLSGAPAGWTVSASPAVLELGARSQGPTVIRVEAPANAVSANSFLLTVKAARLDNASQSDTQVVRIAVADIDAFSFQAFNGTLLAGSSVSSPIVHKLRDEGPDASKTSTNACSADTTGVQCWDGTPDADVDFDNSTLFRLVLTNDGSRQDTITLTPYLLTANDGNGVARTLATVNGVDLRGTLGFQDLDGCDEATDTTLTGDGINDGWRMRMFAAGTAPGDFPGAPQPFASVRDAPLQLTLEPKQSKLVFVEMKAQAPKPATDACDDVRDQGAGTGARLADPAPGHAVLIEAVSAKDASHRATHVLNALLEPSGNRLGTQRYAGERQGVVITPEAGESVSERVTSSARTANFDLRATNTGNGMDKVRVQLPQFRCPSGAAQASQCWEQSIASINHDVAFPNDALRLGAGDCITARVLNPSAAFQARNIYFECVMGAYDEVSFRVAMTAPSNSAIGDSATLTVTAISQDQTSIQDDQLLTTVVSGLYGLDVVSSAAGSAPVHAGATTAVPFTVKNLGTNDDNVTLDLRDSLPAGWTGDFSVANPVFVPAGRQVDVLLFAKAPASATPATVQRFEVRATSLDSPAIAPPVDNITLRVSTIAKTAILGLSAEPQSVLATPGQAKTATVKATKAASNPDTTVDLAIDPSSVPPGWTASFAATGATQSMKAVAFASNIATTDIFLTPASDALGSSRAAIRVLAHTDGATSAGNADNYTLLGVSLSTPNLGVEIAAPDGLSVFVAPGAATTTRVTVQNLGVTQDVIRLTSGPLPTGWNAVFDAQNVTLQPLQKRSVNVTVTAPSTLASGQSRLLSFIATTSDGLRSDSVQLNFTTGRSVLNLAAKVAGTLHQLPQEPFTFTLTVNNTGDLPDDVALRGALGSAFKDLVKLEFEPATFTLAPNQTRDVSVKVTYPVGLAPKLSVPLALEAASKGPFLSTVGTTTVASQVLDHKVRDVDGDQVGEYAVDRDLDAANGLEGFFDPSTGTGASKAIDASSLLNAAAKARNTVVVTTNGTSASVLRFVFDPDGDKKADLLVDSDGDAKPDVYWDGDLGFSHRIPVLKDVTKDGVADYFFDIDGENAVTQSGALVPLYDVYYDPVEGKVGRLIQVDLDNNGALDYVVDSNGNGNPDLSETVLFGGPEGTIASIKESADVDGDGKDDSVIDSDGDGKPDYFVPNGKTAGVPITLEDVNGDGVDDWTYDSDGDGRRDAFYDPATGQSGFIDAKSDFVDQLTKYWYVGALFGVVLVLFVVLLLVTRK